MVGSLKASLIAAYWLQRHQTVRDVAIFRQGTCLARSRGSTLSMRHAYDYAGGGADGQAGQGYPSFISELKSSFDFLVGVCQAYNVGCPLTLSASGVPVHDESCPRTCVPLPA